MRRRVCKPRTGNTTDRDGAGKTGAANIHCLDLYVDANDHQLTRLWNSICRHYRDAICEGTDRIVCMLSRVRNAPLLSPAPSAMRPFSITLQTTPILT